MDAKQFNINGTSVLLKDEQARNRIAAVEGKLPSDASSSNKLITKTVDDLVNYYLKSETYTKSEVEALIGAIQHFHYEVYASTSAVTNPSANVLYLIGPSGTGTDKYEEYVYDATKQSPWIKIGDTSIDLSDYATISAMNTALAGKQDVIADLVTIRANATSAYQKPSGGIPKSDLEQGVKDSLELADTALQSSPVGQVSPSVDPYEYATRAELEELGQEVEEIQDVQDALVIKQSGLVITKADFSISGVYRTTDMTISSNANYKSTLIYDVNPGDVFVWGNFPTPSNTTFCLSLYASDGTPVQAPQSSTNRVLYVNLIDASFTIPQGVAKVGFIWGDGYAPLADNSQITSGQENLELTQEAIDLLNKDLGLSTTRKIVNLFEWYINSSNVWANSYRSRYIEVKAGDVVRIMGNETRGAYVACIAEPHPSQDANPNFKSGFTGIRRDITDSTFEITEDCYFYWLVATSADYSPSLLTINGVDILSSGEYNVNGIEDIKERLDEVESGLSELDDRLGDVIETVPAEKVTPSDFTETGLWKNNVAEIDPSYVNYSAIALLYVNEGQIITFHKWQQGSALSTVAAVFCYDNDGLPFDGVSARKNYVDMLSADYTTGEYTFKVPANCSQIGLCFNFSSYPVQPGAEIVIQEETIALTDLAKELVNNAVEQGDQVGDDTSKYYLKGNSNIVYSAEKKLGIIAAGQSNIDGRNSYSDFPSQYPNPNAKVHFKNSENGAFASFQVTDGGQNNDWSFDAIVYNLLTDSSYGNLSDIYVMKKSMGGTSIDPMGATAFHWTADYEFISTPSHALLRSFESIIRAGIASDGSNFEIKAMLWHQGEGDMSDEQVAKRYYNNLKNMIAYVRGVVGNPRLYFFCGNISLNRTSPGYVEIINAAYTKIASEDPYFKVVDMSNAQLEDGYHFNYQWSIYFGQKVYDLMIDAGIITGTKINPSEPS